MSFAQSIRTCFRKYVTFSGHASRSEFWWFILFQVAASLAITIFVSVFFGPAVTVQEVTQFNGDGTREIFLLLYTLDVVGVFLPMLAVLATFGSAIFLLIMLAQRSGSASNRFGPRPVGAVR